MTRKEWEADMCRNLFLSVVIAMCCWVEDSAARVWRSKSGAELEAEYIDCRSSYVTLENTDGKEFRIHVSQLSKADREYISAKLSAPGLSAVPAAGDPVAAKVSHGKPAAVARLAPGKVVKFAAAGDTGMSYHVYVPTSFNTNSVPPLIIAFSPGGNGMQMVNSMKSSAEKAGWMLIGCNKLKNNMKGVDSDKLEDEVLDDIYNRIPYNSARVYLAGFSGGAMRSYGLSARRPEKIAGIIAYGGWLGGRDHYDLDYCEDMAVAMVNGKKDNGANSWVDRDRDALEDCDCEVRVFNHPGGHRIAPANITDQVLAWLEEERQK